MSNETKSATVRTFSFFAQPVRTGEQARQAALNVDVFAAEVDHEDFGRLRR